MNKKKKFSNSTFLNGLVIKFEPSNLAQQVAKKKFQNSKVLFLIGEAGSGKTHAALGLALEAAKQQNPFYPITICRPAVEAVNERLGFLPGDIEEKIDPYLKPIFDCLPKLAFVHGPSTALDFFSIMTFAHMRGITLDNISILDEAQNCTKEQLLLFLTRLGSNGRMIITGDPSQSDIPNSGLMETIRKLKDIDGVETVMFHPGQNMRSPLVTEFVKRLGIKNKEFEEEANT